MRKMGRIKKAFICLGTAATIAALSTTLTGCATSLRDRAANISDNLTNVCNVVFENNDSDIYMTKFELIGTDVDKTAFDFDVNFNGVSAFSDNSLSYTTVSYEVPSSYFDKLKKSSSTQELYDVFDKIIAELSPSDIKVSPVASISKVNNAFIQNEPSPFDDYNVRDGLLYNLGTPTFNDEKNSVTFNTKTLVELGKIKLKPHFGLGIGFTGRVGLGLGVYIDPVQGTFTIDDEYSFVVDEKTYNEMKNDYSKVYDYCANAINGRDASKISAKRISTKAVTYNQADLLSTLGINDLENGLSK